MLSEWRHGWLGIGTTGHRFEWQMGSANQSAGQSHHPRPPERRSPQSHAEKYDRRALEGGCTAVTRRVWTIFQIVFGVGSRLAAFQWKCGVKINKILLWPSNVCQALLLLSGTRSDSDRNTWPVACRRVTFASMKIRKKEEWTSGLQAIKSQMSWRRIKRKRSGVKVRYRYVRGGRGLLKTEKFKGTGRETSHTTKTERDG